MELILNPEKRKDRLNILRSLPQVLRARDNYLYIEGNVRIVDLWLDGGRAVTGHKSANVVKELKNSAERGLFSAFPNIYEKRFIKALEKLFAAGDEKHNLSYSIFENSENLVNALGEYGLDYQEISGISDPVIGGTAAGGAAGRLSFWRPFLGKKITSPLVVPILPCPFPVYVLISEKKFTGDFIPPVILAPAARAVFNLAAINKPVIKTAYPKIERALNSRSCVWNRQGIYLAYKQGHNFQNTGWNNIWTRFFKSGFLLPPAANEPVILPLSGKISAGEEAKLAALLSET